MDNATWEINARTKPLEPRDLPSDVWTHILAERCIWGNEPVDGTMPLEDALLEPWEKDVHITQYISQAAVRCVKGDVNRYQLRFDFCLFDLDFKNHDDNDRPTLDHFAKLVGYLNVLDYQPNIVYQTRGGCRLVYLIEPTTDALWFESHYAALAKEIETPLINADCGYQLDMATRDWTRLFRSARVTRDGVQEYDHQIRLFHTDRFDLNRFHVKSKPVRKKTITGKVAIHSCDTTLWRLLRVEMREGQRNATAFKACCYALRTFTADAAERAIEAIRRAAIDAGLDENEFETLLRSAHSRTEGGNQ